MVTSAIDVDRKMFPDVMISRCICSVSIVSVKLSLISEILNEKVDTFALKERTVSSGR